MSHIENVIEKLHIRPGKFLRSIKYGKAVNVPHESTGGGGGDEGQCKVAIHDATPNQPKEPLLSTIKSDIANGLLPVLRYTNESDPTLVEFYVLTSVIQSKSVPQPGYYDYVFSHANASRRDRVDIMVFDTVAPVIQRLVQAVGADNECILNEYYDDEDHTTHLNIAIPTGNICDVSDVIASALSRNISAIAISPSGNSVSSWGVAQGTASFTLPSSGTLPTLTLGQWGARITGTTTFALGKSYLVEFIANYVRVTEFN